MMKTPHSWTAERIAKFCEYVGVGRPFLLGQLSNAIEWSADATQEFIDHYVWLGTMREATLEEKAKLGFFGAENSVYVFLG